MYYSFFIASFAFAIVSCSNLFEDDQYPQAHDPSVSTDNSPTPAKLPEQSKPIEEMGAPMPQTKDKKSGAKPGNNAAALQPLDLDPNFLFINEETIGSGLKRWLDSLPIQTPVDSQPPYASYIPSENTLILGRNLALSFTSFELESPLTIRTFGHDIILAGNQLDSVHIDTSHPHSASGSIYVFTESESEPTFRVDGAPGEAGQDGDCSTQPRRCVPVSDRTTRIESPSPTVEWKESTLRRSIEWNDPLLSENFRKDLISKTQPFNRSYGESDLCQNADYAILYEQKQEFSGRLELIQTLKIPISFTNTASESTRNAKLFAGTNGSHGQNSGRVIILKLGTENNAFKFPIPGGLGGKGGRNFKTAALKRLQTFKAESKVISEQIGLANLKVNTLLQGRCGGQIGRQPLPSRAEFTHSLNSETVNMSFGFKLSNDSISLESHNEGIDLPLGTREFGTDGRSGQNGLFERRVYASRDDWESLMPINLIYPNMQKP